MIFVWLFLYLILPVYLQQMSCRVIDIAALVEEAAEAGTEEGGVMVEEVGVVRATPWVPFWRTNRAFRAEMVMWR